MANSPTPNSSHLAALEYAVRKIALRTIVISSIFSFILNVLFGVVLISDEESSVHLLGRVFLGISVIPVSVSLHHILRLWPRSCWSVKSDLIYSTTEFIVVTGYLAAIITLLYEIFAMEEMKWIVPFVFLWLSVGASFVCMIRDLHSSRHRDPHSSRHQKIRSTYDFMKGHDNVVIGRWSLLFGEHVLKKQVRLDRKFVRGFRALVSILCFLGMIVFAYRVLVYKPAIQDLSLQAIELGPNSSDLLKAGMTMEVFLATEIPSHAELFDLDITWQPESQHVPCQNVERSNRIDCPVQSPLSRSSPDNLIITINYTRALEQFPILSLRTGLYLNFVPDGPGVDHINITKDAISLPIQLYPGFHLLGTTYYSVRNTFKGVGGVIFGIPGAGRDQHLVVNVQALIPDPDFTNPNLDKTTATLRLTYRGMERVSQSRFIVQKEVPNSVIDGFSRIGGAWTFVNGAFALVFGSSLLFVLFGITDKPSSTYGLVNFGRQPPPEEQSRTTAVSPHNEDTGKMEVRRASKEKNQDEEMRLHDAT